VRRQVGIYSKANWSLGRAKFHLGRGSQDVTRRVPTERWAKIQQTACSVVATNLCRGESLGVRLHAFNDVPTISNGGCKGMHKVTVVPCPTSLRTSSRNEPPNDVCSRRRNNDSARSPGRFAKKTRSTSLDATPCPSSLTLIFSHSPAARIARRSRPAFAEDCSSLGRH
jgi:hypothetical protein